MDIRSSLDGLKSLLGAPPATPAAPQTVKGGAAASSNALGSDQATFSSAGNEVSLTAADTGVRADKVANIQAALAAGSYNVPASAVASKLVDVMLGNSQ
jgi:negative regulator of flagellin synthesis FlgM